MQLRLLDVQALDIRLDQLAHRRRTLPESAEAERLLVERKELESEVVAADTLVADLGREQRKADADVEQVRTRRARDEQRLQAGQVASPKELESLQHEIESLTKRQSDLEDVELEIMERLEEATARLSDRQQRQADLDSRVADAEQARDAAYAQIDSEAERARAERADTAGGISSELLALYEKRRAQFGGVGAAVLRSRRCEGCRMELDASYLAKIAKAPPEEVLRCEECGRILVRSLNSGV
ncbi:zinc ribbon domain-containing protein [Actinopolymorpha alba]|uniref:zinc ribbon domain-containing protein n=1 Tax=Actinopolymorpha alba TaxID=533267 RepID=UPI000369DFAE|nr:C4-type zinc ribbon domain-containing protein [Actinopolymorpha alba]